jgi:hypothetical protein
MMEDLIINPTRFTPEIRFLFSEHNLSITGESYPENTSEFYSPIFEKLLAYLDGVKDEAVTITVTIRLIYFNSSSSKILINLFDLLENAASEGKNINVNWLYKIGDTDAREFGEEFAEDLDHLMFNLVCIES